MSTWRVLRAAFFLPVMVTVIIPACWVGLRDL